MKHIHYLFLIAGFLVTSCQEEELNHSPFSDRIIHVGGVDADYAITDIIQTRSTTEPQKQPAEQVTWLEQALRAGLDITYSNIKNDGNGTHDLSNERVARLKWTGNYYHNGEAEYTFKYVDAPTQGGPASGTDAIWYDNGPHYFEGQFVPQEIKSTETVPENITTNQAIDTDEGNYTLLSRYLGMPANWTTAATVQKIKLPFKHRLSRVIAYILIDEDLKKQLGETETASLEGYGLNSEGKDDPQTTKIRFDRVKVLKDVKDENGKLTPEWENEARRVIPHFFGEFSTSCDLDGSNILTSTASQAEIDKANEGFIVYINNRDEKKIHPRDDEWKAAHADYVAHGEGTYTKKIYKKVPVYDIIVRPTYTSEEKVMYDEDGFYNPDRTINETKVSQLASIKNSIDFELTLNNGLTYTKKFEFDLDANQQTVVYITIDREGIEYDESTSEVWASVIGVDDYYGVNNHLGHNMSIVGSSWQRAFRNGTRPINVTDGNNYNRPADDVTKGQYVNDNDWIAAFLQAREGGEHHGDYFILDEDITIDVALIPDNFVFTGHLDGWGSDGKRHTITVTGSQNGYLFAGLNAEYVTPQETDPSLPAKDWEANIHKGYNNTWVPEKGFRAELLNLAITGATFFPEGAYAPDGSLKEPYVTGYVYNCYEIDKERKVRHDIYNSHDYSHDYSHGHGHGQNDNAGGGYGK